MRKRSRKITAVILAAAATAGVLTGCGAAGKDIGQDEAKRIAFEDAGVSESDTSRLKVEKDRDDGMLQYEVQFSVAEKEYSYDYQRQQRGYPEHRCGDDRQRPAGRSERRRDAG